MYVCVCVCEDRDRERERERERKREREKRERKGEEVRQRGKTCLLDQIQMSYLFICLLAIGMLAGSSLKRY